MRKHFKYVVLIAILLFFHQNPKSEEKKMCKCSKEISPVKLADLQKMLDELPDGSSVCLKKGKYPGGIFIRKSVTLKGIEGAENTIFDSEGKYRAIAVTGQGIDVHIQGITIKGGNAFDAGAGLAVQAESKIMVSDCIFQGNMARQYGGGAVYVNEGKIVMERCRFTENTGGKSVTVKGGEKVDFGGNGGAVLADGIAEVILKDSLIVKNIAKNGSALKISDGAKMVIERCTIADNEGETSVETSSTSSRSPAVTIYESIVQGKIVNTEYPKQAVMNVQNSVIEKKSEGITGMNGNKFGDPLFAKTGDEPYTPVKNSPAAKSGKGGGVDLRGTPRPEKESTLGAIEIR
jgi:hypothetical protein